MLYQVELGVRGTMHIRIEAENAQLAAAVAAQTVNDILRSGSNPAKVEEFKKSITVDEIEGHADVFKVLSDGSTEECGFADTGENGIGFDVFEGRL
jgi:hypothetical protein